MPGTIQFVKSTDEFEQYTSSNKYLVANFTASWCGPCQAIKPLIDQLYNDPDEKYNKIEVVRIDLDQQRELAGRYQITGVPTFIVLELGQELERVTGANVPAITQAFTKLADKALKDTLVTKRNGNGTSAVSETESLPVFLQIKQYIPAGFEVLNNSIYFGQFESSNSLPLSKDGSIKDIFELKQNTTPVISDADSQMLFYVPLTHISKVHSILIGVNRRDINLENSELDDDELENETQVPNLLKVWVNDQGIKSFDDVSDNAAHVEQIAIDKDQIWYRAQFKFVRFQNVQSLSIFIDGDDEDLHTVVDKLVIIGVNGESKDQPKLSQLDE